ncbi:hypothetical protein SPHINGOT1_660050 [Sphingomonas sp. T1]|nr:hypothetical protein SPHINGOT1_660050 [Sphingomonas sp. T1]
MPLQQRWKLHRRKAFLSPYLRPFLIRMESDRSISYGRDGMLQLNNLKNREIRGERDLALLKISFSLVEAPEERDTGISCSGVREDKR